MNNTLVTPSAVPGDDRSRSRRLQKSLIVSVAVNASLIGLAGGLAHSTYRLLPSDKPAVEVRLVAEAHTKPRVATPKPSPSPTPTPMPTPKPTPLPPARHPATPPPPRRVAAPVQPAAAPIHSLRRPTVAAGLRSPHLLVQRSAEAVPLRPEDFPAPPGGNAAPGAAAVPAPSPIRTAPAETSHPVPAPPPVIPPPHPTAAETARVMPTTTPPPVPPAATRPAPTGPTSDAAAMDQVAPEFPDDLRQGDYKTSVLVRVEVDSSGNPSVLLLTSSGNREVDRAVLKALKQWKWKPAFKSGVAVASAKQFRFNFVVE